MTPFVRPVVLLILDGWGVAPPGNGNPLASAKLPNLKKLIAEYPTMTLEASGGAVGLSWGEMGNSEVGHLTIGAGCVFYQSFPRINLAIQEGAFFSNHVFLEAAKHAKKNDRAFHIIGIVSPGNVHGSSEHVYALLQFAKRQKLKDVFVHVILDGRDTIYNKGIEFVGELEQKMLELGVGKIASISGRYYAMDRDKRWDRTALAYNAMIDGKMTDRTSGKSAQQVIAESYEAKVFDEEFVPVTLLKNGDAVGPMRNGDTVVFANFRADRAIQLTRAFTESEFTEFPRMFFSDLYFASMMEYEAATKAHVAFPPEIPQTCLAKVISDAGLTQLHVAETEKFKHVTFFLNGLSETIFPGEDRLIIPSPKVASYDQAPAMSASKIAEQVVKACQKGKYDVVIANFANADMVGHTGKFAETERAAEIIDMAIGKIKDAVFAANGCLIITADHGNAEEVRNLQTDEIDKEHSTNSVPFIVAGATWKEVVNPATEVEGDLSLLTPVGVLGDVAPTILSIIGIPQPPEMTGSPLV